MKHSVLFPKAAALSALLACLAHSLPAATGLDSAGQLATVLPSGATGFAFVRLEAGVQFRVGEVTRNVLFHAPGVVRVNSTLGRTHADRSSFVVVKGPQSLSFTLEEAPGRLLLKTPELRVVISKEDGALTFLGRTGQVLTREKPAAAGDLREVSISGAPTYEASQSFVLSDDEALYGLGQYNEPHMNLRDRDLLLVQTNIGIVVPFMMSTRRYGILWDMASRMTFSGKGGLATLWAESAPAGMDYYFVAGDTMDSVVRGYRELTGPAPMFPKAAFGLFMSKERYQTQAQLLDVARSFRSEGFPLDYIVQDWQYWGGDKDGTWSGMIWDKERFPDPAGMARTLHEQLNLKLMNSIWPSVGDDTELAHELDAKGLRFKPKHWISRKAQVYDAFSEEGRSIYFKHIKKGLLDVGVDALWMDGTEVEVGGACHDPAEVERDIKGLGRNAAGDFSRNLNNYSLLTTRGTYEGQRAMGDKRVFTLTRSAWAGQQRYAAMPWSGDTTASWATFAEQISGGIGVAMAGMPYWTQDTGGFFVNISGGERNPEYQELYARWNQFGIFNPIYRIHGTNIAREPYLFKTLAPELHASLLDAARLRYRLLPYIYGLAWRTTTDGYTLMRGLPMDFPDDPRVRSTADAFMFGPAFLVHPVTRPMYHVGNPPATTIPSSSLRTPDGKPGLAVQYFKGVDFNEPAGGTVDATVDHTWPGPPLANPPPGLSGFDYFSARWTGSLLAEEDGEHEIVIEFDDGGRLYFEGRLVAEDWSFGPKRPLSAKVTLSKGHALPLVAEFHQGSYARAFRLAWRRPSQLRALAASRPVIDNTQETYLPAGADWFDFRTQARHAGGSVVRMACPLDKFPIYVRAGSIVPFGPEVQYATEKPDAPLELRVYPGADTSFTLHEDDNETYAYERGEYADIPLTWTEATRTFTVGPRKGTYPGMVQERELRILLVRPGEPLSKSEVRTLRYSGKPLSVHF